MLKTKFGDPAEIRKRAFAKVKRLVWRSWKSFGSRRAEAGQQKRHRGYKICCDHLEVAIIKKTREGMDTIQRPLMPPSDLLEKTSPFNIEHLSDIRFTKHIRPKLGYRKWIEQGKIGMSLQVCDLGEQRRILSKV